MWRHQMQQGELLKCWACIFYEQLAREGVKCALLNWHLVAHSEYCNNTNRLHMTPVINT